MKYFIVAKNLDGVEVKQFDLKEEAETFCAAFLADHKEYAGEILLAVNGERLTLTTVEIAKVISLVRG